MIHSKTITFLVFLVSSCLTKITAERKIMKNHTKRQQYNSELPIFIYKDNGPGRRQLPRRFNWLNHGGINYLTRSLNQHLPTYCGSCWAHAAVSILADRIKIIRMVYGKHDDEEVVEAGLYPDVSLSIQFILNCGGDIAGSCHGGSATGAFQFIKEHGYIPFESCQPYMACSSDSKEKLCQHVDTQCNPINICKTCTRDPLTGTGVCHQVQQFPRAEVDEYGVYELRKSRSMDQHVFAVKAEIEQRGPVTAGIAGHYLRNYTGGVILDNITIRDLKPTHEVSIVGWDFDKNTGVEHWIIRNSWGEYWGELGFFRLELGKNLLGIEEEISWATVKDFTIKNVPCYEDGSNCNLSTFNFVGDNLMSH